MSNRIELPAGYYLESRGKSNECWLMKKEDFGVWEIGKLFYDFSNPVPMELSTAMNAQAARIERLEKALTEIWENGEGYDKEGDIVLTNDAMIAKTALAE